MESAMIPYASYNPLATFSTGGTEVLASTPEPRAPTPVCKKPQRFGEALKAARLKRGWDERRAAEAMTKCSGVRCTVFMVRGLERRRRPTFPATTHGAMRAYQYAEGLGVDALKWVACPGNMTDKVAVACIRRDWTLADLADHVGCTTGTLYNLNSERQSWRSPAGQRVLEVLDLAA